MGNGVTIAATLVLGLMSTGAMAQDSTESSADHPAPQGMELDLTKPFHTRTAWRFVTTEGPQVEDYGGNNAPGVLTLCLRKGAGEPCVSGPVAAPAPPWTTASDDRTIWAPHYLIKAQMVYPRGPKAPPFLLIVTGSLNSGDGDQIVATQLIAYDAGQNTFRRVYGNSTGHNNNQETRFVTYGPLRGNVITAEPQEHLPFGYWIGVNKLTPAGAYHQVLRYRSATRYNDGNPLAVIDSEMPNIQKRLGLWKPGMPIPTPSLGGNSTSCSKPTLRNAELWCD
jgi:hypothetical protein